nr:hypothetical protein [Tanacetum cinerariifolium]
EQAANARYWKITACCDDDDDYNSAITPVLSTEEPDNSLTSPYDSELVSLEVVEIVIPEDKEIKDDNLHEKLLDVNFLIANIEALKDNPTPSFEFLTKSSSTLEVVEIVIPEDKEIKDDNLHEKLLDVNFLIANIEALKDNPTPSFEFLTKSSSTSPKSFLEETNTFDNSLPEFKNFCFDLKEISSGSTTTHSDISLFEYDLFTFDLSNDQFPSTDRSNFTHEEFVGELAYIISPPEYDCFYFRNLPYPSERISILNSKNHENLSSTT